ncbi:methyltransferase domain-containing protein [Candidatus Peregrinibacteria bacterium]|nr:methyltransferase domain-containing protein [Candidatus Peregrinibacteria bacterium]
MDFSSAIPYLACPETGSPLKQGGESLVNEYGTKYEIKDGIPRLLIETKSEEEEKVRQMMQKFYETVTFPGYDGIDSPSVLMDKAQKSGFGRWLDEAIPPMASVLEVGCGTGQMTNFLGLVNSRKVIGMDQSIPSLLLGEKFKEQFDLKNVSFVQGNIFTLPAKNNSVDVLICSGVLHHTPDPYKGFTELLKKVKTGGYIVIGLYNSYARMPLGARKCLFKCTGGTLRKIDAHMRRKDVDQSKKEIWFSDQYRNPHESWHSVDEVLKWFEKNNVEFVSGVPDIGGRIEGETPQNQKLFADHPKGNSAQHILKQIGWAFTIGREGGLFVLVGKKK